MNEAWNISPYQTESDKTGTPTLLINAQGLILAANEAWLKRFRCSRVQAINRPFKDFVDATSLLVIQNLIQTLDSGHLRLSRTPLQIIGPAGFLFNCEVAVFAANRSQDGQGSYMISMRELTRTRTTPHRDFLELAGIGVLVFSAAQDHAIVEANRAACTLFRTSHESLLQKDMKAIFPKGLGIALHGSSQAADSERSWIFDTEACREDGSTFSIQSIVTPTRHNGLDCLVVALFDITERKSLEEQRLLSEMAAGIAHEINNPLAIADGMLQVMQKHLASLDIHSSVLNEDIHKARTALGRAAGIVQSMLQLCAESPIPDCPLVSLNKILEETLALCSEKIRSEEVTLTVRFSPKNAYFHANALEFSQVLLHVINNALLAARQTDDPWIAIEARVEPTQCLLTVMDSGNGIPRPIRDRMFQPFFTTRPIGSGTGLSLSVSRAVMERMGGSLSFDSESPHTRFIISVPRVDVGPE